MMRANVELRGSLTHTARGRKFRKNFPQTLTNVADIRYYKSLPDFHVVILDDLATKKATPGAGTLPPVDPAATKAAVTDSGKADTTVKKVAPPTYTRSQLAGLRKEVLMKVADELEVLLEGDELKKDMVDAILEAQEARDSDDTEEDDTEEDDEEEGDEEEGDEEEGDEEDDDDEDEEDDTEDDDDDDEDEEEDDEDED